MPRESGGSGKSKPEMITEVLAEDPAMATPRVQSAVWEQFGEAVTAREIAQARRKLREVPAPSPEPPPVTTAARVKKERPRKPAPPAEPRRRAPALRAKDFTQAEVTVGQLSAILEVAEEVGGLRRLQESLRTVLLLREKVGAIDEQQLAYALDFLARLTGKR